MEYKPNYNRKLVGDLYEFNIKEGKFIVEKKRQRSLKMLFEDNKGKILVPGEIEEISPWEIEERGIHVCEMYY